jgi:hypothetical protein
LLVQQAEDGGSPADSQKDRYAADAGNRVRVKFPALVWLVEQA